MNITSFNADLEFGDKHVLITTLLESTFSKEIRIVFKKGQLMKEHKTAFPIIVHVLSGQIDFGVENETHLLDAGGIIALEGNIPHDLVAREDSVVRLTLSKLDKIERVEELVNDTVEKE